MSRLRPSRWSRRAALILAGGAALSLPRAASAYCRARTCDPTDLQQRCEIDANGCVKSGQELFWASRCVTFGVHEHGSPAQGIAAETVERIAERAFLRWLHADCGGEPPSIQVGSVGSVACGMAEYNQEGRNANIVLFRDDEWPYEGSSDAYGHTRLSFDTNTGEIFDADISINTAHFAIATEDGAEGADLESILVHEFGHFLGLAHAAPGEEDATMRTGWNGEGTELRSLSPDDQAAICAAYPPDRKATSSSCEPRHGFASECGVELPVARSSACSVAPLGPGRGRSAPLVATSLFLVGVTAFSRRARRV